MGAKHTPGRTASSTAAGNTACPRRERTSTRSPFSHPETLRVVGVQLQKRLRVEFVQLRDPSGLGHAVPLMLQAAGSQHHRVTRRRVARRRGRCGSGEEAAHDRVGGRERQRRDRCRPRRMCTALADAVIAVADRVALSAARGVPATAPARDAAARSRRREDPTRCADCGRRPARRKPGRRNRSQTAG